VRHPRNNHRQRRRQLQALRRRHLPRHEPIQNPDGTITFIDTVKGLPEKLSIPGGPTLLRDAGVVTVTTTLRPLGDDEFEIVSQTFSGEHGPHPDLESDFELFCEVLVPALT
jgi:hypothetical protein